MSMTRQPSMIHLKRPNNRQLPRLLSHCTGARSARCGLCSGSQADISLRCCPLSTAGGVSSSVVVSHHHQPSSPAVVALPSIQSLITLGCLPAAAVVVLLLDVERNAIHHAQRSGTLHAVEASPSADRRLLPSCA